MDGELERRQQDLVRVSDADRFRVAEVLREAAGEGRLDLDELDQRLEAAYAAKTYADLVPLTADLPVTGAAQVPTPRPAYPPASAPTYDRTTAVMSGSERVGPWVVGAEHTALAVMGGVTLDLREARLTAAETVITANAFWGGIEVIVGPGVHLVVEGSGFMGGFDHARDKVPADLRPDSPVVRVRGLAVMGGVTVQRRRVRPPSGDLALED
jgi:Domain of unknown function (DUF1707)